MSNICRSEADVKAVYNAIIDSKTGRRYQGYDYLYFRDLDFEAIRAASNDARKILVKMQTVTNNYTLGQAAGIVAGPIGLAVAMGKRLIDANGVRQEFNFTRGTLRTVCAGLYFFGYREDDYVPSFQLSWRRTEPMQFPPVDWIVK